MVSPAVVPASACFLQGRARLRINMQLYKINDLSNRQSPSVSPLLATIFLRHLPSAVRSADTDECRTSITRWVGRCKMQEATHSSWRPPGGDSSAAAADGGGGSASRGWQWQGHAQVWVLDE